jgi:hypothetical protein
MINKVPILIYTHSEYSFLWKAMIPLMEEHAFDSEVHFCYDKSAPAELIKNMVPSRWILHTYDESMVWTDRVLKALNEMNSEYILFLHEDWLPIAKIDLSILSNMAEFMKSRNIGFLNSHGCAPFVDKGNIELAGPITIGEIGRKYINLLEKRGENVSSVLSDYANGIYTGYEDYYFYREPDGHVFQPAIWRYSVLKELCTQFKIPKNENENWDVRFFLWDKQTWSVRNIKTMDSILSMNSLFFPHMHALSAGQWNFQRYPSLKALLNKYGIDTTTRSAHPWWMIGIQ